MSYIIPTGIGSRDMIQPDGSAFVQAELVVDAGTMKGNTAAGSALDSLNHGQGSLEFYGGQIVTGTVAGVDLTTTDTTVANQEAGNYIMKGVAGNLATVASTILATSAADFGRRRVHKRESAHTTRVAEAIRAGSWDIYSGAFSPAPTTANDFSGWGADDAAEPNTTKYGVKGEIRYRSGGPSTTAGEYESKTG
jgi:hypothetical protein